MPAIAEFFKTALDSSLAKLVQPSAIVPAAVFVLLNALFIQPTLVAAGIGPAVGLNALADGFKVAVIVALILLLGYILLALNSTLLRVATGELWRGSLLYRWMLTRATGRLQVLGTELNDAIKIGDKGEIAWLSYERKRWPAEAQLTPTRLGNALGSTATAVYERYGMDMNACWPPLQALVAKEGTALATLIDEARGSLDLLLNLAFVFGGFGVEGLLIHAVTGNFQGAAYAVLAIPVGYGCYRAASARAVGWGNLIETAFDLYRDLLATALGLRQPSDFADAKELWQGASRFLLYPASSTTGLFEDPTKEETVAVSVSGNLEVTKEYADEVVEKVPRGGIGAEVKFAVRRTNMFTITAKRPTGIYPVAGHLRVDDIQSGVFDEPPTASQVAVRVGSVRPEIIGGDKPLTRTDLLWHVRLETPANAIALRYDLPLAAISIEVRPEGWIIELDKDADPRDAIVKLTLRRSVAPDAGPPPAVAPAVALRVTVKVAWSRWKKPNQGRLVAGTGGHLRPGDVVGNQAIWSLNLTSPTSIKLSSPEEPT